MSAAGGVGVNTALADAAELAERLGAVGFMQSEVLEAIAGYGRGDADKNWQSDRRLE